MPETIASKASRARVVSQICDTIGFMAQDEHVVGLRELRHRTSEVLARVRAGESIDVTEYGRLIARIVPVAERDPAPVLDRLAADGRLRRATRPGFRPRMRPGDGSDRLGNALAELREEERW
jgi:prevent-host-death family protein